MPRCLFIDLIDGKHISPCFFKSTPNLEIDYTTNSRLKTSSEYEIIVIHGHGESIGNKTVLYNYGECDKGQYDEKNYKPYGVHDFSEMLEGIQSKYILVFIACNSYSSELSKLINDKCIAVVASKRKLADDSRMELVLLNLIIPLSHKVINKSDYKGIEHIVENFNALVECDVFCVNGGECNEGEY